MEPPHGIENKAQPSRQWKHWKDSECDNCGGHNVEVLTDAPGDDACDENSARCVDCNARGQVAIEEPDTDSPSNRVMWDI